MQRCFGTSSASWPFRTSTGSMQQAHLVQASNLELDNKFFSWPSMHRTGGPAEECAIGSSILGIEISCPLTNPPKKQRVNQETAKQDGRQLSGAVARLHSPDCLYMKCEQPYRARQAASNSQEPLPNDYLERQAGSGSEQEDDALRKLQEEGSNLCGCNESQRAKSFWAKGWHPRVDNSALGFEENNKEALNGLQDVVSYTAVSFAAYRAIESERPDALFQDPLAAYLAGDRVVRRQKAEVANKDYPGARFAVRTKYFDLAMMSAIQEIKAQHPQAEVQVVLFGCGMDARSWRLPATPEVIPPADMVFEGDRPDVMGLKEQLLKAREETGELPPLTLAKQRVVLAVDFNTDTWKELIVQKGFRKSEPTVWLFEGLIMYLTPEGVANLVETVAEFSAPGSVLLIDGISASAVERAKSSPSPVLRSWTWGSNDPETYFNAHGWRVTTVDDVTGGMFGRSLPSWPRRERYLTWYMTAERE